MSELEAAKACMVTLGDSVPMSLDQVHELKFIDIDVPDVWCIDLPGLGILILTQKGDDDKWRALYSPSPGNEQERKVIMEDGVVIVPMLHKRDRLDVHFTPPKAVSE